MKRLNSILLWVGIAFLACLIWTIGPRELSRELRSLGWGLFPFALGEGLAEMIHTLGWRRCLGEPYRSLSWGMLFRIRMSGYAINYLTPTAAMGGEATKVALLSTHYRGPEAVSGVLIEKVSFALAQVLFVVCGALFLVRPSSLPRPVWVLMLSSSAIVVGGIVTFLILQKHGKLGGLIRWLDARSGGGNVLRTVAVNITGVDEALRGFYRNRRADLWLSIGWHLAGCLVGVIQTWFFFKLLNQERSLLIAATAWTLALWFDLLTFAIPLNAGSLEGSRILTFQAVGFSSLAGLTYGVAVRLSQLLWSGVGLVLYGSLAVRESRAVAEESKAIRRQRAAHNPDSPKKTYDAPPSLDGKNSSGQAAEFAETQSKVVPI